MRCCSRLTRFVFGVGLLAILFGQSQLVQAQSIWDGGGADDFWMTPANWIGDVAPTPGTAAANALQFAGNVRLTPNNNFAADSAFAGMTFNAGAGSFGLSGNRITLAGNIVNSSGVPQTIGLPLLLNATRTVDAGTGGLTLSGNISDGAAAGAIQELTLLGNGGTLSGAFSNATGGALRVRLNALNNGDTWSILGNGASTFNGGLDSARGVLNFGDATNSPSLTITRTTAAVANEFVTIGVGAAGTSATFNMKSGNLTLNDGAQSNSRLALGNTAAASGNSGSGTWNQTGGTVTLQGFNFTASGNASPGIFGANQNGTSSAFNVSGGLFDDGTAPFNVAVRGVGTLTVSGTGILRNTGSGYLGAAGSTAATDANSYQGITINDDRQASGALASVGTLNLDGGTLETGGIRMSANRGAQAVTAILNFNGGTLKARATNAGFLTMFNNIGSRTTTNDIGTVNVRAGGAVIDTNGFDIGFDMPLLHESALGGTADGGLTKNGNGTLTLNQNNTFTGPITINGGNLQVGNGGATGSIASAGAISGAGGTTLIFNSTGSQTINSATSGGVGITKNLAGSVTLSGTNTYTGTTTINAGTLNLSTGSSVGAVVLAGGNLAPATGLGTVSATALTAGSGTFLMDISGGSSDVINVSGAASLSGSSLQMSVLSSPTLSSYTIISAGSLTGLPTLTNPTVGRTSFSVAQVGNTVKVNVTGGPATLRWDNTAPATGDGMTWDTQSNQNWRNGATPDQFFEADTVTFNDTNNSHYAVSVSGTVKPFAINVTNSLGDYNIGGGEIGGGGTLTKSGTSALTLSGPNTYTGGTVLNTGTLLINSPGTATAGPIGTGRLTINAGTLDNNSGSDVILATNNLQTWASSFTFTGTNNLNLGTGAVTLNASPTITVNANTLTIGGPISNGTGNSITKAGAGILSLGGASTYTGGLTVNAGTVRLTVGGAGGTGTLAVNANSTAVIGGTLTNAISVSGGTLAPTSAIGTAAFASGSLTAAASTTSTILLGDPQAATAPANNLEMIFTGVLHGSGNFKVVAGTNTGNAPDSGGGLRLRGTAASDFTGTISFTNDNGLGSKGEIQTSVAGPFSPAGSGTFQIAAGTFGTTLVGTYTEFNVRNNGSGNTVFGNNVVITGTGLADFNLLGTAPAAGVTLTSTMGNLTIGTGQILGVNKTNHTLAFQTVTLAGSATFAAATNGFGATGAANLNLGPISESTLGSGVIVDGGSSTVAGFGVVFLNGNNSFTGGLTINNGTAQIGNLGALNSTSPNTVTFGPSAGSAIIGTGTTPTALLRLAGSSVTAAGLVSDEFSPGVAAVENASATAATLTVNDTIDNIFNGVLRNGTGAGALALTKGGAGRLTLGGANTYTGPTTITAGILRIGDPSTSQGSLASTAIGVQNGTLQLGVNASATTGFASGTVVTLGSGLTGGTLDLAGFNTTLGGLATSGTGTNRVGNSGFSPSTLTVNALTPASFGGTIQDALPGGTSTVALNVNGGSLTLSGANSYTGGTTINSGNLIVTGSLAATAPLTVKNGGTLSGSGSVGDVSTEAGSTLRPGVSGTDGITNTLTMHSLSVGGGDLQFELIAPGNADKLVVNGPATFNGASTITPTSSNTANGTYTLLTASGGVSGTAPTPPTGARQTFTLHFGDGTSGPNAITLNVVGAPKSLTWTGGASSIWTAGAAGPVNWSDNGGATTNERFFNLDSVAFGNGGANHGIALNSSVSPTAVTVDNDGSNPYVISGTGEITGAATITKNGVGSLTLATNNTYSGVTTINGGTLTVGNGGTTGSLGSGGVVNNATLIFNRTNANTVANNISGTGTVQSNSGVTTLSGTNTYSGGTVLSGGTIQVAADELLGAASGGLSFGGGALETSATFTTARASTVNAGGGTLNVDPTTTLNYSGVITGSGLLQKSGTGALALSGANTFTGGLQINDGIVQVANAGALNAGAPQIVSFGAGAPNTADLQLNGNSITLAGLSTNATTPGTPVVENANATATTLTVNATANSTFGGTIQNGSGAALALTKTGSGKLTLTGTNAYTGVTTINGGTIEAGPASSFAGLTGQVHFLTGTFHVTDPNNATGEAHTVISATTSNKYTTSGTGGSTGTFDIDPGVTLQVGAVGTTTPGLQTAGSGTAGSNFIKTGQGTLRIVSQNNQLDVALLLQQGTVDVWHARGLGGIDAAANFLAMSNGTNLVLSNDNPTDFLTGLRSNDAGGTINVASNRQTAGDGVTHAFGAIQAAGAFTMHVTPGANVTGGTAGLTINASLNTSQPAAVLSGNGTFDIVNSRTSNAKMVMTINGGITGAGFGITKTGNGTLVLSNTGTPTSTASTYTGTTTVNQGTLQIASADLIPDASNLVLGGGRFSTGGFNETVGTLKLNSSSAVDLSAGSSILHFADSGAPANAWTPGSLLTIANWSGNIVTGGGADQVIFNVGANGGLSAGQVGAVHFAGYNGASLLGSGEVVPTSVSTRLLGDWNFSNSITQADIPAMLSALADLTAFKSSHSLSTDDLLNLGDIDVSGNIDNADIQAELDLVISSTGGGAVAGVPEPATIGLGVLAALGVAVLGRRKIADRRKERR